MERWNVTPDLGGNDGAAALALSPDESKIYVTGRNWVSRHTAEGALDWATDLGAGAWGTSLGTTSDGIRVAGFVDTDMLLADVDAAGSVSWSTQEPAVQETREHLPYEAPIAFREDLVYVGLGSYGLGPSVWVVQSDGSVLGNVIESLDDSAEFSAIAVEPGGNLYAAGFERNVVSAESDDDGTVYAFDTDGNLVWSDAYDLQEGSDVVTHVAIHPAGGIVALGVSEYDVGGGSEDLPTGRVAAKGSGEAVESVLLRYEAAGSQLWRIDTPHGEYGGVGGLSIDDAGRIFVSRYGPEGGGEALCRVTAYDNAGSVLWQRVLDEVAEADEECYAQVLAEDTLVVAVGGHDFSGGGVMLRAYDTATGADAWSVPGNPVAPLDLRRLATTTEGGVAAASRSEPGVVRVDGTGALVWQVDAGIQPNKLRSVVYDPRFDHVIVAGEIGDRWIAADGSVVGASAPQTADEPETRWVAAPDGSVYRASVAQRPGHSDDLLVSKLDGIEVFSDGFESGGTSAWSSTVN